jgi:N-acetyl-gamma-glutamyl-phosphate reductase
MNGGNVMIKVGIVGATGYAGAEIVRLLLSHPQAEIKWYGSKSYVDQAYADVYKNFFKIVEDLCKEDDLSKMAEEVDVIFTATPQGYLASVISEEILQKAKVIDLSADFRLKDVSVYEKWYGIEHKATQFLDEAVYGLCEINREKIKNTRLLANPGCYTTCSILTAYPLVKEGYIDEKTLIVDAKSGTSGAGRGAKIPNLFCEVNESIKPYGVTTHRHTPEIEEQLGYAAGKELLLNFTPHLAPMNRGILATEYATLIKKDGDLPTKAEVRAAYEKYYGKEHFIRLLDDGIYPETRWVEGSNFVDIGFKIDERTGRIIMMGAIDNLVKGAAGQAVQNMNLIFGLPENEGLLMPPVFP